MNALDLAIDRIHTEERNRRSFLLVQPLQSINVDYVIPFRVINAWGRPGPSAWDNMRLIGTPKEQPNALFDFWLEALGVPAAVLRGEPAAPDALTIPFARVPACHVLGDVVVPLTAPRTSKWQRCKKYILGQRAARKRSRAGLCR